MPAEPLISVSPKDAIELAFVSMFQSVSELSSGIDIVAASDRDALVGPVHAFALCTEFSPIRGSGNGKAAVAIGIVTDMDDQGNDVRRAWLDKFLSALTSAPQPAPDYETGIKLISWKITSQKEQSDGRKIMDVMVLDVAACAA